MLIRIVRMTFLPGATEDFLAIFTASKNKIRNFGGCLHLELWQDADNSTVFTTYSHWEDAAALEKYRRSDLFKTTWANTKVLFAEKPVAWSNVVKYRVAKVI